MKIFKGFCSFALLTAVAVSPVLAAGAPSAKPLVQPVQIGDVPARGEAADSTVQTTSREDVGFDPAEIFFAPKACSGGNATFTWTIIDDCIDGLGIYVRFFDETNDLVFPNSSQAYIVGSGRSSVIKLSVKRGAKICYGAEPSNFDGSYWGVSLDDSQGCTSCCNIVPNTGNLSRSVRLTC